MSSSRRTATRAVAILFAIIGPTLFYVDTNTVNPENTNWCWAKVRLDGDFSNCPNRQGVTAHEMGHGMGLAHVSAGNPRLMRWDIAGLSTTDPWPDDVAGINHLYRAVRTGRQTE